MDSTHTTNKHSWKLYIVLVRDSFGSWLPGGHFLASGEEQSIVAKGLQVLKGVEELYSVQRPRKARNVKRWLYSPAAARCTIKI